MTPRKQPGSKELPVKRGSKKQNIGKEDASHGRENEEHKDDVVKKVLPELGGICRVAGVGALPDAGKGILGGTDA